MGKFLCRHERLNFFVRSFDDLRILRAQINPRNNNIQMQRVRGGSELFVVVINSAAAPSSTVNFAKGTMSSQGEMSTISFYHIKKL